MNAPVNGAAQRDHRATRLAFAAMLVVANVGVAQTSKVRPVDEAAREPSLVAFRRELLDALARQDTAAVMAAFAPNVLLDFGGGAGIELLRERFRTDRLWAELVDVLEHGGRFVDDTTFYAPYWFGARMEEDAFDVWIVIGTAVRVRAAPGPEAELLTALSYDVVAMNREARGVPADWGAVTLADGRHGFVAARYLRSPIGYRVGIRRVAGRWRIVTFVAGD